MAAVGPLVERMQAFGIGHLTNVDLAAETPGPAGASSSATVKPCSDTNTVPDSSVTAMSTVSSPRGTRYA